MGGSSIRIQGSLATDTGEFDTDIGEFRADTGELPGCLTKQPVQKVGWAVFLRWRYLGYFMTSSSSSSSSDNVS